MQHLLIVGAGYLGQAVGAYLAPTGTRVTGLIRSPERLKALSDSGIQPWVTDVTRLDAFPENLNPDAVLFSLSPAERTEQAYEALYVEGTRNVLQRLPSSVQRIVYLSSTGVWPDQAGGWVDEETPVHPQTGRQRMLLKAEQQVLQCGIPAVILRLSGIYGPGRHRLQSLQDGTWPVAGPDRYMNLIYREDAVRAIETLFRLGRGGEIYIGTDDQSVLQSTLSKWLSFKLGLAPGMESKKPIQGKRCRNVKLKQVGFAYQYPTFREGYNAILSGQ